MTQALFIVDVQNDFTEEGALAVVGGTAVAAGIEDFLVHKKDRYSLVFGSRDWHHGDDDNGGHFARDAAPDFVTTWPVHCVAGTPGADYHPELDPSRIDVHLHKGMGIPAYSLFEGVTVPDGRNAADLLAEGGITHVDIAGLATDYCVLASAKDALAAGLTVRVLTDLIAGVAPASSEAALVELQSLGAELITSATV